MLASKITLDAAKAFDKSGMRLVVAMACDFATVADFAAFSVKGGPRATFAKELETATDLAPRTVANASTQASNPYIKLADRFIGAIEDHKVTTESVKTMLAYVDSVMRPPRISSPRKTARGTSQASLALLKPRNYPNRNANQT